MNYTFIESLEEERNRLRGVLEKVNRRIRTAPEETLHALTIKGKYHQYYAYNPKAKGKRKSRYLGKEDRDYAKQLAQVSYDCEMRNVLEKEMKLIEKTISLYQRDAESGVYEKLSEPRRVLVEAAELSDEDFISKWREGFARGENSYPIQNINETELGEVVRSKSEKAIADKLFYMGIPYVYEPKILLDNGHVIYPDFAVLNVKKRKTFLLEYFGMMNDSDYVENAVMKIKSYSKNGYILGDNLLALFEYSGFTIDTNVLGKLIDQFLI